MTRYYIFLDDDRFPPNDDKLWVIIRKFEDFIWHIERHGLPEFISFDHDIRDFKDGEERTGYTCAKWLVEHMMDNNIDKRIDFFVHSQNPEGAKNIKGLLNNWNKRVENLVRSAS
jgi:hypothetical protein